jgi:ABC-2 type transport system ATP-binding protein
MIDKGKITVSGKTSKVALAYRELNNELAGRSIEDSNTKINVKQNDISADVSYDQNGGYLEYDINITSKVAISDAVITFVINRENGEMIYRWASDEKVNEQIQIIENGVCSIRIKLEDIFPDGVFDVQLGIKNRDRSFEYAIFDNILEFEIIHPGSFPNDTYWKPYEEYTYIKEES